MRGTEAGERTPEGPHVIDGQHTAIAAATHNQLTKKGIFSSEISPRIGPITDQKEVSSPFQTAG
jgi:hypothetical protein